MELFRIFGELAIRNDEANRALDETASKAEGTAKTTENAFSGIGKAALGVGKVVLAAGAALGGAWIAAIEGTREYRTHLAMLDTAFQMTGHSSETARQTYSDLNAVLGDSAQATEAAQQLAKIADNESELSTLTTTLTGVYATFGESLPIEGLAEGINHSAKLGEVQGSLADALEWSGITVDSFNKQLAACSSEQERQDLIVKTLKDTYSKAGEQYQKTNADVLAANRAQEKLTAAFSELGRIGEPILTAIKTKIAEMVTAAVPKLEALVKKVKDVQKWMKENRTTVNNWKAAIVGAAASAGTFILILKWGKIMTAAKTALLGVRTAVLLLNAAMKANIIGLIISLVVGLVAAFVVLWKENDKFRAFWISLWNKLKSACNTAINGIKNKFNDLKDAAGKVKKWFEDIRKSIADKINGAWDAVKKAVGKIKGIFPLSIGKIFSNFKIPKISVSGGKMPYGIGGLGKLPSFSVKWNKTGAIFDKPTIFGTHTGFQGVGDGGEPEAVSPISVLQGYVSSAVRAETGNLAQVFIDQNRLLMELLQRIMPKDVYLDRSALVGALLPAVDSGLAERYIYVARGNVR